MLELHILIILFCMTAEAFFSGIETGVISIHRLRLRHFVKKGSMSAKILQDYIDHPDRLFGTTLVGTNLCTVATSVTVSSLAKPYMGNFGEVLITGGIGMAVLIFSEYLPKAWFNSQPLKRCSAFAGLLRTMEIVLWPLSRLVMMVSALIVSGKKDSINKPPFVTKEDLKMLAQQGEKDGVLSPRERFMIHRVIELSNKKAKQIMIPYEDIKFVYTDTTLSEFFNKARDADIRRMPVMDRQTGEFVGIINVFYALRALHKAEDQTVSHFMRKPLFISEETPVDDILPRMRRFRQPMSLVKDSSERVVGLITTEDVLQEIVGKL